MPTLPGKDLSQADALAYAVREQMVAMTPEERAPILAGLHAVVGDVYAPDPTPAQNPAFPGYCGTTAETCDADPAPTDYVRVPPMSLEWPVLASVRRAQAEFDLWHPHVSADVTDPSLNVLGVILRERVDRFGGRPDLALASVLLAPDTERRLDALAKAGRLPTIARVASWMPAKKQGLVVRTKEAITEGTLYAMAWPVTPRASITSSFGPRLHPVLGKLRMHKGVDVAVATGTEIRAPLAGTVLVTHDDKRNGLWLEVDHGGGIVTVYCHASEIKVTKGQKVAAGDVLALSGATGIATGPHLHYQLHVAWTAVDPLRYRAASADMAFQQAQLTAAASSP